MVYSRALIVFWCWLLGAGCQPSLTPSLKLRCSEKATAGKTGCWLLTLLAGSSLKLSTGQFLNGRPFNALPGCWLFRSKVQGLKFTFLTPATPDSPFFFPHYSNLISHVSRLTSFSHCSRKIARSLTLWPITFSPLPSTLCLGHVTYLFVFFIPVC